MKAIMLLFCKDKRLVVVEINEVKKIVKDVVICNKFFDVGADRLFFDTFNRTIYFDSNHICFTYLDYEKNSDKILLKVDKLKKKYEKTYGKIEVGTIKTIEY
jgi:hypothetical protein